MIYEQIERSISALIKPAVVGINGVDTSDKTIFARSLDHYFRRRGSHTALIHTAAFHNPRSVRYTDTTAEGYIRYAFDLPRLTGLILELKQGAQKTTVDLLNLNADAYTNSKTFEAREDTIIIIEGVLLYRPPLNALFGYRIFLDVSFDEVQNRTRERDVPKYGEAFMQRYTNRYIPAQKLYLKEHRPKENSQMVIDNNDFQQPRVVKPAAVK